MPQRDVTKNFIRERQMAPSRCARGSFRMKSIGRHGRKIVVCCPKGHFRRGRCSVGVRAQSLLTPR